MSVNRKMLAVPKKKYSCLQSRQKLIIEPSVKFSFFKFFVNDPKIFEDDKVLFSVLKGQEIIHHFVAYYFSNIVKRA